MKTKWWWNDSFDDMMKNLSDWVGGQADLQIAHLDWKYVHPSGKNQGYWYMLVIYK